MRASSMGKDDENKDQERELRQTALELPCRPFLQRIRHCKGVGLRTTRPYDHEIVYPPNNGLLQYDYSLELPTER